MATSAKHASLVLREPKAQATPRWLEWLQRAKYLLGLDRAIAYTVLARAIQILGSTGTVLLILRFLTPVEQGYYYTLLSLVSLQTVFELGFSFVILQMAAHESVHLTFHPDGRIEGDPVAHARLASILQKTVRWYLVAAVLMWMVVLPVGVFFFSGHARGSAFVPWQGPWLAAISICAVSFLLNPLFSFLEGCGQVWQVAGMHLGQALLAVALSWVSLLTHHGLYSPAGVMVGYVIAGAIFLWRRRRLLMALLPYPVRKLAVSWRSEVLPFQWRIAVSWMCSYFTVQIFTPVLFACRGPIEAGQMGMSLSITGYLSFLMLAWISTKAAPFGQMIARREFAQLDRTFFRTLRQSLVVLALMGASCITAVTALQGIYPRLSVRMVAPPVFLLLIFAMMSNFIVQSIAIYLRSFKREPLLYQYMAVALLTIAFVFPAAKRWGSVGAAACYALSTGVIGLMFAVLIFQRSRKDSLRLEAVGHASEA